MFRGDMGTRQRSIMARELSFWAVGWHLTTHIKGRAGCTSSGRLELRSPGLSFGVITAKDMHRIGTRPEWTG